MKQTLSILAFTDLTRITAIYFAAVGRPILAGIFIVSSNLLDLLFMISVNAEYRKMMEE
jgi:hypothetical protein